MATLTNTVNDLNLTTAIGGAVPGAGDSVYISYYNLTYNAGTDLSTNAVALCHLGAGFTGSFTQGSPLKIKATTGSFVNEKGGTAPVYLISVNNATVIQTLVHGPKQGTLLDVNTCAVTTAYVKSGQLIVESDCDMATCYQYGSSNATFIAGSFTLTLLETYDNATAELKRDVTTLAVYGQSVCTINSRTCSPTTINMRGGRVKIKECGAVTTINGYAGTLDLTELKEPLSITTLNSYPGLTILVSASSLAWTPGTTNTFAGGAKVVNVDAGAA